MKDNDFKIVFDSNTHEVDVETLIGNLMHTSNIIQEVNRSLQTEKKIEVKIKALEKGSFEVHIELIEKIINSLFSNEKMSYGANIIVVIGGLYGLAKFLLGKKPKDVEKTGDDIKITNNKGDITIFKGDVFNIYNENKSIRDGISKQFDVLDKNKDIKGFKFESNNKTTYIPRKDFESIATKLDSLDEVPKDTIVDTLEDKKLLIIRPSFIKNLKWDFVFEGQKISAKMDEEQMNKIDNGESFSKGDYMRADIEVTKFYDKDLDTHLITKDSYKIIKYKEHIKSAKQNKLF